MAIICSGTDGAFSLDDGLCAGLILHKLNKRKSVRTNDFGRLNAIPFDKPDFSIPNLLSTSFHLNRLKEKGYTPDIEYCLQLNSVPIIPIWDGDGFIELRE